MTATVPSSDIGIASTTFMVLDSEPRKSQQTSAVSSTAKSSSRWISWTESSMKRVRSKLTERSIPSGRLSEMRAISARTSRATATALAPRCFLTPIPCDGLPLVRAKRRMSAKPSSTRATSER